MQPYSTYSKKPYSSLSPAATARIPQLVPHHKMTSLPRDLSKDITVKAVDDFNKVFRMFDTDHDDFIDRDQFKLIIGLLGDNPSEEQLDEYIRRSCDRADDDPIVPNRLSSQQFLNFFADFKQDGHTPVDDGAIFDVLDEDGSGMISSEELCKMLGAFGLDVSTDEAEAMTQLKNPRPGHKQVTRADFRAIKMELEDTRRRDDLRQ